MLLDGLNKIAGSTIVQTENGQFVSYGQRDRLLALVLDAATAADAANLLEQTLAQFQMQVKVVQIDMGPVVTQYEMHGVEDLVETGAAADDWAGRRVVVPAVIPCGECDACRAGRGSVCPTQIFPGNDVHGGFASHFRVPAHGLCEVPDLTDAARNPAGVDLVVNNRHKDRLPEIVMERLELTAAPAAATEP